jgi:putative transposase
LAERYGWKLQAWAVFPNHYHFVGVSEKPESLRRLVQYMHSASAKFVNQLDRTAGRKVWHQYWESHITYPKSFLARLNYVHTNPVRHRVVREAERYPWCSAAWFARTAARPFYNTVMSFPSDRTVVPDNFTVNPVS